LPKDFYNEASNLAGQPSKKLSISLSKTSAMLLTDMFRKGIPMT